MKTLYANMFAFGMMTGLCMLGLSSLLLILPLLSAFIMWDLAPLSFGWSTTFGWLRVMFAFSAFMGIMFTSSKEGQALVKDIVNG